MNIKLVRSPMPALLVQPLGGQDRVHHRRKYRNPAPGTSRTWRAEDEDANTGCQSETLITDFGVRVRPGRLKSP
jgi:hypothetical protein